MAKQSIPTCSPLNSIMFMFSSKISMPELATSGRTVNGIETSLFDSLICQYDIIFGRDFPVKKI